MGVSELQTSTTSLPTCSCLGDAGRGLGPRGACQVWSRVGEHYQQPMVRSTTATHGGEHYQTAYGGIIDNPR